MHAHNHPSSTNDYYARNLFSETKIPKDYILKSGSFKNDSTDTRDIISTTFQDKYQSCIRIDLSKLYLKNKNLLISKIITEREYYLDYDQNQSGNAGKLFSNVLQKIWFNTLEDAKLFHQQLDSLMTEKHGQEWNSYIVLEGNCVSIGEMAIITAAEMLSANPLLLSFISEHISSSPLSFQDKFILLKKFPIPNQYSESEIRIDESKKVSAQVENHSAKIFASDYGYTMFNSSQLQQELSISDNQLIKSLMEKCGINPANADKATFSDFILQSGIKFPLGTSVGYLKSLADKFKAAGISCDVMKGDSYFEPKIIINKKKSELLTWVQEKNTSGFNLI